MANYGHVIFYSLIGGVFSLIGGVLLLGNKNSAKTLAKYATPFAAGALLAAGFLDLLKEGVAEAEPDQVLFWAMVGLLIFFFAERFLHWFHHHHQEEGHGDPTTSLVIFGDILHNALDGVAIAAAFLISVPTGIVTTLAVAAHEIPQEIGDFGLLLNSGMKAGRVLLINLFSSLTALLGAVLTYLYRDNLEGFLPLILSVTAGFFIYIALANLVPEIHNNDNQKVAFWETVMLFLGVLVVYFVISALEGIR